MPDETAPLVALHESWISLDPVQGCPAGCSYCYLMPKRLNHHIPQRLAPPEAIYARLNMYRFFQHNNPLTNSITPICIGNYTDMCLTPANRAFLLTMLQIHQRALPDVPVCIVTKAVLDDAFLQAINASGLRVIFFVSLSFLPKRYELGTPPTEERLRNFARIAKYENLRAIHFWRPITALSIPDRSEAQHQFDELRSHGAKVSVITGLKYGERLAELFMSDPDHPFHTYFMQQTEQEGIYNEIFEPELRTMLLELAHTSNYPVYLHTSCAVSYVLQQVDYNATFRDRYLVSKCLKSYCPPVQRAQCFQFRSRLSMPPPSLLSQIANLLDLPEEAVAYSPDHSLIVIQKSLTQEEQTFVTHLATFPIQSTSIIPTLEWIGSINRKEAKHAGF